MTPDRWRQIEDLYHAARERGPGDRAALLEQTDPEIRARVERMLAVDSSCQILDQSPEALLADPTKTVIRAGTQLRLYRIEAQIGAGGMGTVYRAVDTRLGRVVAIKIASERYSERFQLEARAISTLNHPNICTLHDIGPNYLVMELIEGSTLAAEIAKGPMPPEATARYGAQIAGALAEAHLLGIVHRDLKPPNIMVTRHGVKVLDFGLAQVISDPGIPRSDRVMGTPAYMAPEQIGGHAPSASADLYALGLVLYEMSVGRLPFPSRERPPTSLDDLVERLLEKDPAKRPQSAAEVARELSAIADRLAAAPASSMRPRYLVPAVVALLLLAAGLYLLRSKLPGGETPIPNNPAAYTQLTSFTDSAVAPVLSPDGRMLAFYRSERPFGTSDQIWIKLLPNGEPVQVTHDPRPKYNIAFSPGDDRIAYTVFPHPPLLFQTYTVSSLGGDSELLLPNSAGLSWLDDGHILFSQIKSGIHMGIVTSKPDRSELREIYFPAHERGMAHYSYLSPDEKWVLLAEMVDVFHPCRVVPFSGASAGRQAGPDGVCTSAAWSPDGNWMYFAVQVAGRSHLWRQRFPDGQPHQITFGSGEESGIAMAPDGRSLITSIATRQNAVWIHDAEGDRALSTEGYAEAIMPTFSRDGRRLYYLLRRNSLESPAELVRAELSSGNSEVILPGVSIAHYDISSDEKDVVFSTEPPGQSSQIWIAALDRSAAPRRMAANGESLPHFGPHHEIVFRLTDGHAYYVGALGTDGTNPHKALPVRITNFGDFSPDRRFVAVTAVIHSASLPQTLVLPLDGSAAIEVCNDICAPSWSPDGRYLYLQIPSKSLQRVNARTAAIPIPPGQSLPPIPAEAIQNTAEWAKVPGVHIVERSGIAPGPDPSTYAYIKPSVHANLYRIPLK